MSDYRTTTGEPLPESRKDRARRRRVWFHRGMVTFVVVTVISLMIPVRVRVAANGYVAAGDYAEVRPSVAGRVAEILGQSGEPVAEGALLVQQEDGDERAALAAARRAVEGMEARVAMRLAELQEAALQREFRLREATLHFAHAEQDLRLMQELHSKDLASERMLAQSRLARDLAQVALQRVEAEDLSLPDKMMLVMARELDVLRSEVVRAELRLAARRIEAPIKGRLVRYEFARGELVAPEHLLYEIFGEGPQVLKLRVPERFATRVMPGAPYQARVRAVGRWSGKVVFRGDVQAMRSIIQSDSQHAYRMVYCSFDAGEHAVPPGASAEARITVARVPFLLWMFGIR